MESWTGEKLFNKTQGQANSFGLKKLQTTFHVLFVSNETFQKVNFSFSTNTDNKYNHHH